VQKGERIGGRFTIERFVSRGGMGDVYLAHDERQHQPVALKILTRPEQEFVARFDLEAKALIGLQHPSIVGYVDHSTDASVRFLAMEWLDGCTLSQRLRERPMTAEEALIFGIQAAEALGAAHAAGMVHRDVKPANLFLQGGAHDRVKVLDFGIVQADGTESVTAPGMGIGTPEYMSPEQAKCEDNIGPAADVFALGSVLFRCLTGRNAYRGQKVPEILAKIAFGTEPPRIRDVDPTLPVVVDRALAKMMSPGPAQRPQDGAAAAKLLRTALEAVRVGIDPVDSADSPTDRTMSQEEMQPVAVILALVPNSLSAPARHSDSDRRSAAVALDDPRHPARRLRKRGLTPSTPAGLANGSGLARGSVRAKTLNGTGVGNDGQRPRAYPRPGTLDSDARTQMLDAVVAEAGLGRGSSDGNRRANTQTGASGPTNDTHALAPTIEHRGEQVRVMQAAPELSGIIRVLRVALAPYDARVELLLDGSIAILLSGGIAARDLAARAGRAALTVRSLVSSASVAVATFRAVRAERGALDPVIESAAKLAVPGSRHVFLDGTTRDLLPSRFDLQDSKDGGVVLVSERDRAYDDSPRTLLGKKVPCFGRNRYLRQLVAAFEGVVEDQAAESVLVVGDAGVGKTRLRSELLDRLIDDHPDLAVLSAAGDFMRTKVPFGMIARCLRRYLSLPQNDGDAARQRLSLRVHERVPEHADAERIIEFLAEMLQLPLDDHDRPALRAARTDPNLMADQLRRAWHGWLQAECRAHPVMFIVDDLQWSDASSVDVIGSAIESCRDLPLAVLALARPEVDEIYADVGEKWGSQTMSLGPLRQTECEKLVDAALGDSIPVAAKRRLIIHSAGNPFYLEELIRNAAAGQDEKLPDSVINSVQLRIGNLTDRQRLILRAGSIYGRQFHTDGVAALVGEDIKTHELVADLMTLEQEDFLRSLTRGESMLGDIEWMFRHAIVREAAYEMVTERDKRNSHRRAGQWLMDRGEQDAAILAEHFAGGGQLEKASEYFQRAAEDALRNSGREQDEDALRKAATCFTRAGETSAATGSNAIAEEAFSRAISLFEVFDSREAAKTRLSLSSVLVRSGERPRALALLDAVCAKYKSTAAGLPLAAQAAIEGADVAMRLNNKNALAEAIERAEEGLALAQKANLNGLQAQAGATVAVLHSMFETEEGRREARKFAAKALPLARQLDNSQRTLWRLGNVHLFIGELENALTLYEQAAKVANANSDILTLGHCHYNQGIAHLRGWSLVEGRKHASEALRIYRQIGDESSALDVSFNLAAFELLLGDVNSAATRLEALGEKVRDNWFTDLGVLEARGFAERLLGNEAKAADCFVRAASLAENAGAHEQEAKMLGLAAEAQLADGRASVAIESLERAVDRAERVSLSHALLMARFGQFENSERFLLEYTDAEPEPERHVIILMALARSALRRGDQSEARAWTGKLEKFLSPSPSSVFATSYKALAACVEGNAGSAVALLCRLRTERQDFTFAEATLDVASMLVTLNPNADPGLVRAFLRETRFVQDHGVLWRIKSLAARLAAQLGDAISARELIEAAREAHDELCTSLPEPYSGLMRAHPWVADLSTPLFSV